MLDGLWLLIALGLLAVAWQNALAARERARLASQRLCAEAGVQLLDQTVALRRLALARGGDGRLVLRRWFSFELSTDGVDRHRGSLRLLGDAVEEYSLPQSAQSSTARPALPH